MEELRMLGQKRKKFIDRQGFSMIELMVALAILAVGLLAIIQLQVSSINSLAEARHRTVALELAERKMELLKTLPFDPTDPKAVPTKPDGTKWVDASGKSDDENSVFYDNMIILPDNTSRGDGLATLHWDDPVDENGVPVLLSGSTTRTTGKMAYVVVWTIERGGTQGTSWPAGITPPTEYNAEFFLPGPNQMRIKVIVGWYEPYEEKHFDWDVVDFASSTISTLPGTYDTTEPWKPDPLGQLIEHFPHRIILECVRDQLF